METEEVNQCENRDDLVALNKYRVSLTHLRNIATGICSELLCDSPHFRNIVGTYTSLAYSK